MNFELIQKMVVSVNIQQRIQSVVNDCLDKAIKTFGRERVPMNIPVVYKTKSSSAGLAKVKFNHKLGFRPEMISCQININPVLLNENIEYVVNQTVPHEVAHVVAYSVYSNVISGHGVEWISIMKLFGCDPHRCHKLNISTINQIRNRNRKTYNVTCSCGELLEFSSNIVTKMKKGKTYRHIDCGTSVGFVDSIFFFS